MKQIKKPGRTTLLIELCVVVALGLAVYGVVVGQSAKHDLQVRDDKLNAQLQSQNSTQKTDTSTSSTTQSAPKTPVAAPSTANDVLAATNASQIQSLLEAYFANYGFYPGVLTPQEFAPLDSSGSFSGSSSAVDLIKQTTTTPTGYTYNYAVSPSGCTTAGNNCLHYTLTIKGSGGTVVASKQDMNN